MKTPSLLLTLIPLAAAKCGAPTDNFCASFVFANGTVSQDILLNDGGCTEVANSNLITGIKVYDCWCGLWNAQSTTACNNGYDEVVDQINQCTGLVDGKKKGWKWTPTHVSCYRP